MGIYAITYYHDLFTILMSFFQSAQVEGKNFTGLQVLLSTNRANCDKKRTNVYNLE